MSRKKPRMAICYDFDGTLAPGNMQEYDYIPRLKITSQEFWEQVNQRATEQQADEILSYMCLMLEKANADKSKGIQITKKAFADYAQKVTLYPGVEEWFSRINEYGRQKGLKVEHYIISSGIREMIAGTAIAKEFTKIYASSFMYDQNGVAYWPALAVNYTTKTQFLFRINKGYLDEWDNTGINDYLEKSQRPIPFERMIYIGDGYSDVPCMRLVKDQGGTSIAVYKPRTPGKKEIAMQLMAEGRVSMIAPADYRTGKKLDVIMKRLIDKIAAEYRVLEFEQANNS
ncbi:MAG: haloacid dehalogenase-like hydrolase [Syntrophomonadaceae bacterium]|jgi:phosphoserine phosphatase|nr:haloacid dehalogenase-like hydrolase [Syntrophomonadaceae bacterium]